MNSSRNKFIVITVLAISLIITAYVSLSIKTNIEKITEQDFNFHSNEILNIVSDRLDDYAHILQSGVALFNASQKVTREEWKVFNETQKIEQHLPGIQGFGFSLLIPPSELARHTQKIREEGFPLYKHLLDLGNCVLRHNDSLMVQNVIYIQSGRSNRFNSGNIARRHIDLLVSICCDYQCLNVVQFEIAKHVDNVFGFHFLEFNAINY